MERITGVFTFTRSFTKNWNKDDATVKLEIDYKSKTFSITPPYGKDSFTFKQTSKDYQKWLAILACIEDAIEFANYEIGVTQRTEQAKSSPLSESNTQNKG